MKIAVAGASGLIGSALLPALRADGHDALRLGAPAARASGGVRGAPQHRERHPPVRPALRAVGTGAGVGVADRRWNERHKQAVLTSRVDATATLSEALA